MKTKFGIATAFLFASFHLSYTQVNVCGTDLMHQKYKEEYPERIAYQEQMREMIREAAYAENHNGRNTLVIPTVIHILHKGGNENITNEQVFDAMRVLNEDLRRTNSDTSNTRAVFKPYGADFNVEFRLAKVDPNGNCTNGITNTFSSITYEADDRVKRTSQGGIDAWPVTKYFNIWVVGRIQIDDANVIGYAYFPSWGPSNNYGVVINHSYFGTIGAANGKDGRTLTHEVGHCLELYHTFQSGCGGNCSTSGDAVCDTPPVVDASFTCNFNNNTCSNDQNGPSPYTSDVPDMVENYMSYNQNGCQNIFTKGQKLRSDAALQNTFLSQLYTSQNLLATGAADGFTNSCVLAPNFDWNRSVVCQGDAVHFSDLTQNGYPTTYQWNIVGPETLTASVSNPTVTFNQPGMYNVSLSVTNGAGVQTATKQSIIRVTDSSGTWAEFYDGMDNQPISSGRWHTKNSVFQNGWEQKTLSNGNAVIYINNFENSDNGIIHELYSPAYDVSGIGQPKVRFKTAYAQRNGSTDRIRMYMSADCGETWTARFAKNANFFTSMPANSSSPAEPLSASDWSQWEVDVSITMQNSTHLMMKFNVETGLGNNIYLDDINIVGLGASVEEFATNTNLNVFPNPSNDEFNIDLSGLTGELQVSVYDMSGRTVLRQAVNGGSVFVLSGQSSGLASGMYRVSVKGKNSLLYSKIMLSQ